MIFLRFIAIAGILLALTAGCRKRLPTIDFVQAQSLALAMAIYINETGNVPPDDDRMYDKLLAANIVRPGSLKRNAAGYLVDHRGERINLRMNSTTVRVVNAEGTILAERQVKEARLNVLPEPQ